MLRTNLRRGSLVAAATSVAGQLCRAWATPSGGELAALTLQRLRKVRHVIGLPALSGS